jgi:hypothetical protein
VAKRQQARSISALLVFTGLVLLGLCVVTVLRRQDVLAGGLAVLSLGAMVLAALTPRLTGTVEMGLSGFKMELVKLTEIGRLADYSEEEILATIENKLHAESSNRTTPELDTPTHGGIQIDGSSGVMIGDGATQHNKFGKPDFEDLLDHAARALARGKPSSPEQAKGDRALAEGLFDRARMGGRPEDLEAAIKLARSALAATPQDSPMYAETVQQLATALQFRYYFSEAETDRDEIAALLSQLEDVRRRRVP